MLHRFLGTFPRRFVFSTSLVVVATAACSSSDSQTGTSSTSSSSASASASTGSGGTGGAAAQAGSGGATTSTTSTSSASTSTGGGPLPVAECVDASECKVLDDCCNCGAVSNSVAPPKCGQQCLQSSCMALGEATTMASCSAGRCTMFDCETKDVTCKKATPSCPAGQVPLVEDSCWGGCVPATQCNAVDDCSKCDANAEVCITETFKGGPKVHCVPRPSECSGKATCECLGKSVCVGKFDTCSEDANGGIQCGCTTC